MRVEMPPILCSVLVRDNWVERPSTVRKIAAACKRSYNETNASVNQLSRLGGGSGSNASRDLSRLVSKLPFMKKLAIADVDVFAKRGTSEVFEPAKLPMLYPHDIVSTIWRTSPGKFEELFIGPEGNEGVEKFWNTHRYEEWFLEHPNIADIEHEPSKCLPVKMWGDKAPVTRNLGISVLTMSPVMSKLATMMSRVLLLLTVAGTVFDEAPFYERLAWSFAACASGKHPRYDWDGNLFSPTSKRGALAGELLCGGFSIILAWVTVDEEWISEIFMFENNYNVDELCRRCKATKRGGLLSAFNFCKGAPWTLAKRFHESYRQGAGHNLAILKVPGVHLTAIKYDPMHVMFWGILQWCLGSCFIELLQDNFWKAQEGGRWDTRYTRQLKEAFSDFRRWCRMRGIPCSQQRRFTLARLCTINR